MLTRLYNLSMHAPGLPIGTAPWRWIVHWSRLLENDLETRRLKQRMAQSAKGRRNR